MLKDTSVNKSILVKIERDPLSGLSRDEYKELLKKKLKGRVVEAYIFGSFNTSDFNRFSDIDLLLVSDAVKPFIERGLDFSDIQDMVPATDILVYTPAEFSKIMSEEPAGFWKSVRESMVRIL
jgi:predicted nucleotidyltransferase